VHRLVSHCVMFRQTVRGHVISKRAGMGDRQLYLPKAQQKTSPDAGPIRTAIMRGVTESILVVEEKKKNTNDALVRNTSSPS